MKKGEALRVPEHSQLAIGDLWKYSHWLAEVSYVALAFEKLKAGEEGSFGPLTTWLPSGGEYEIKIWARRKK